MATAKMSATLDADLLAQVRTRVGPRGVSSFVNEAVAEKLQRQRVLELIEALEVEKGRPTAAERKAAEAALARLFRGA